MDFVQYIYKELSKKGLWSNPKTILRNDFLKRGYTKDTNLYYVINGSFRIYLVTQNEEQTIRFGYKNNLISALDSFITEQPSSLYIQAIKKSTVVSISKSNYMNFIQSSKVYSKVWFSMLELLLHQQMEREIDLLISSPLERYKRVIKRSPQLFQEIPDKYIASYLRMTPETLSRIKKS